MLEVVILMSECQKKATRGPYRGLHFFYVEETFAMMGEVVPVVLKTSACQFETNTKLSTLLKVLLFTNLTE